MIDFRCLGNHPAIPRRQGFAADHRFRPYRRTARATAVPWPASAVARA